MANLPASTTRVRRSKNERVSITDLIDKEVPGWQEEEVETVPIEIFGEDFDALKQVNIFNLLQLEDAEDFGALSRILTYAIVPDQRVKLRNLMARQTNMKIEVFAAVVKGVLETVSGEVPTKRPSDSGRSAGRKAVTTQSADG